MLNTKLKSYLDELYLKYKKKHSSKDPVWILHEFRDDRDIELAGLITSCYAYGQVDQINFFIRKFLNNIGYKVYEFTSNYSEHKDKKYIKDIYYRFNSSDDLSRLLINLNRVLEKHSSLKKLFIACHDPSDENIINALQKFTEVINGKRKNKSSYDYLIPSPEQKSTCKRLNLYLRWMIRKDEIDTGIWSPEVSRSQLIMPVDIHVYRIARKLKMVKRKSCDLKFAVDLTNRLKKFDPEDPVKYDFALCHVGIDKERREQLAVSS